MNDTCVAKDFWSASLGCLPTPKLECHVSVTLSFLRNIGNEELRNDVIKEQREIRLRDFKHTVLSHLDDLDGGLTTMFEEYSDIFKEDQMEKIEDAMQIAKRRISLATLPKSPVVRTKARICLGNRALWLRV